MKPKAEPPMLDEAGKLKSSFRRARSRASRACEICHARKVRCDVTVHMPCTNCVAFGVECRIPERRQKRGPPPTSTGGKRRKKKPSITDKVKVKKEFKDTSLNKKNLEDSSSFQSLDDNSAFIDNDTVTNGDDQIDDDENLPDEPNTDIADDPSTVSGEQNEYHEEAFCGQDTFDIEINGKVSKPGGMSFFGSTSNLNLILNSDSSGENSHILMKAGLLNRTVARSELFDKEDLQVLKMKSAFLLPERSICDSIVKDFFQKLHPLCPLINKTRFMRKYNDPANPPSLLLLQAILVAGSKVCRHPALFNMKGSSRLATATFYKRAKALFDYNYETDKIAVIQAAVLLGWWNDDPQMTMRNVFYWTRVAITIAQAIGLHREIKGSQMAVVDQRHMRRLFWCLFTRDRTSSVALGRPVCINLADCDVAMLTLDDFNEDESDSPMVYPVNGTEALSFIHTIKLAEIMGLVLEQQFTVGAEMSRRLNRIVDVSQCDLALATWISSLPRELKYSVKDKRYHNFSNAYMHLEYYTVLCLVHRSNVLHHRRGEKDDSVPEYPSWGIAFQAAHMITRILDNLMTFNELEDCPAFVVYATFSAMILLIYQTESSSQAVKEMAQHALKTCTAALERIAHNWSSAKQILSLLRVLNRNHSLKDTVARSAKHFTTDDVSPMPNWKEDDRTPRHLAGHQNGENGSQNFTAAAPAEGSSVRDAHSHLNAAASNKPYFDAAHKTIQNPSALSSFASELFLVTSTTPEHHIDAEDFRPSHLFPETNAGSHSGSASSGHSGNAQIQRTPRSDSDFSLDSNTNHDLAYSGMMLNVGPDVAVNQDDHLMRHLPNTINIDDWYQFLLETTGDAVSKQEETQLA